MLGKILKDKEKNMANDNDFYDKIFPLPGSVREPTFIESGDEYERLYRESIKDPDAFWAKGAEKRLTWSEANDRLRKLMKRDKRGSRHEVSG